MASENCDDEVTAPELLTLVTAAFLFDFLFLKKIRIPTIAIATTNIATITMTYRNVDELRVVLDGAVEDNENGGVVDEDIESTFTLGIILSGGRALCLNHRAVAGC